MADLAPAEAAKAQLAALQEALRRTDEVGVFTLPVFIHRELNRLADELTHGKLESVEAELRSKGFEILPAFVPTADDWAVLSDALTLAADG